MARRTEERKVRRSEERKEERKDTGATEVEAEVGDPDAEELGEGDRLTSKVRSSLDALEIDGRRTVAVVLAAEAAGGDAVNDEVDALIGELFGEEENECFLECGLEPRSFSPPFAFELEEGIWS